MQQKQLKILREVASLPTAPFYENKVATYIKNFAEKKSLKVVQDLYGNLLVEYQNGPLGPPLGFMAHMDHPGFEVQGTQDGYLKLAFLGGGVCPAPGDKLRLFSNDGECKITVHSILPSEPGKIRPSHLLAKGKLPQGQSFAMYDLPPYRVRREKIYSRAIDDLAGCAALLCLLELLHKERPQGHIHLIFSRAEEVGFIGACGMALGNILPTGLPIITLEASKKLPEAQQGKGVVVRIGDRLGIFDPDITGFLLDIARSLQKEKESFQFQRAILDGGVCESSLLYSFGYPTSGVAVPLGCYHNHGDKGKVAMENIHLHDWQNMIRLLWEAILCNEQRIGRQETGQASFISRFQKYRSRLKQPGKN